MSFELIPVTKTPYTRKHADVAITYSEKRGMLSIVLSPSFFANNEDFKVGNKVLCGWDAEEQSLVLLPVSSEEPQANSRLICKRTGWDGAGQVNIPRRNIPETMRIPSEATQPEWSMYDKQLIIQL